MIAFGGAGPYTNSAETSQNYRVENCVAASATPRTTGDATPVSTNEELRISKEFPAQFGDRIPIPQRAHKFLHRISDWPPRSSVVHCFRRLEIDLRMSTFSRSVSSIIEFPSFSTITDLLSRRQRSRRNPSAVA